MRAVQDLKISVAEILGRPGLFQDVKLSPRIDGVATTLARLEEAPLDATLRAESVVEGILVTGSVSGGELLECARCLKELRSQVNVEVCELFEAPGHESEDDSYRVSGNEIDLEPMLRDNVTLALPLKPVCSEDCKGLCATCGTDLNVGSCDCTEEVVDERWAPLSALKEKLQT